MLVEFEDSVFQLVPGNFVIGWFCAKNLLRSSTLNPRFLFFNSVAADTGGAMIELLLARSMWMCERRRADKIVSGLFGCSNRRLTDDDIRSITRMAHELGLDQAYIR